MTEKKRAAESSPFSYLYGKSDARGIWDQQDAVGAFYEREVS